MTNSTISTNVTFQALTTVTGKGVTMADKVKAHISNGAEIGALLAQGVGRKAIIDAQGADGMAKTVHQLAHGNIRSAAALVVAKSGKAVSIMEIDGKAPYSEWLRIGATLQGMTQSTKAGKPTMAAKALALHTSLTEQAAIIRANKTQKIEA
jgi:hypothetical protein